MTLRDVLLAVIGMNIGFGLYQVNETLKRILDVLKVLVEK